MFIIKEDLKSIFRRLDALEQDNEHLREKVGILQKQMNCNHGFFRGERIPRYSPWLPKYVLVCVDCGKRMKSLTYEAYCWAESEYFKRLAEKQEDKEVKSND